MLGDGLDAGKTGVVLVGGYGIAVVDGCSGIGLDGVVCGWFRERGL